MLTAILAILAISAAAGMRLALPLLIIGFIESESFWSNVPLLNRLDPQVILAILISWSLFELFGSKQLLGQRVLQLIQLALSPLVGLLLAVTVGQLADYEITQLWLVGISGGVLAFLLQLVQVGWFFRLKGIPPWVAVGEDILSILLVFYAFSAPEEGGLIAMMLVWIAIRSSTSWKKWHQQSRNHPQESKEKW
ncbi:hypothetical protein PCC7418_1196 [Halothece sp. PCC 7418]|uniref:DUF4126 domain-containing protein n=1 Tax=Halothece sp. (strain PCC 7418) TaxID=65093 RepID=UPI0002A06309|nr:DUF4126 domain-containing protein [Halothece sp. PCC 7418]AFZ43398.1 hypothetical protein PCC7418_1196 [Halothece sp. PCC 7418]